MIREVDGHSDPCTRSPPTTTGATIVGGSWVAGDASKKNGQIWAKFLSRNLDKSD